MSLVRDQHGRPARRARSGRDQRPPGVLVEDYVPSLPVTVGLLELPSGVLVFPPLATRVDTAEFYDAAAKRGGRRLLTGWRND
jgi:D-alanine-D-alanine ligase